MHSIKLKGLPTGGLFCIYALTYLLADILYPHEDIICCNFNNGFCRSGGVRRACNKSRHRAHVGRAVICCCILAVSTVGFVISTPNERAEAVSAVHVTVSPVRDTSAPAETDTPADQTPAPVQLQGSYTASSRSDKFHMPFCPAAARISEDNRVWFSTRDEAVAAGYSPCGRCKP